MIGPVLVSLHVKEIKTSSFEMQRKHTGVTAEPFDFRFLAASPHIPLFHSLFLPLLNIKLLTGTGGAAVKITNPGNTMFN